MRKNELSELPSSLWFQLTRYQFDWNTGTKKKVRSRFSFPNSLDMAPYVGEEAQKTSQEYDLVGVLIHTGSSANAGHYTAHLRVGQQQWWKFDDESVTKLNLKELGEEPEATAETAASKAKKGGKAGAKKAGAKKGVEAPAVDLTGADDEVTVADGPAKKKSKADRARPAANKSGAKGGSEGKDGVRTSTNACKFTRNPSEACEL